ncbi:MAG TPA: Ig-like domain-containing protein, partial [Aquabacterium sp.]|nr:Ig-like domain-containing protein [Aquabacterium sp.]
ADSSGLWSSSKPIDPTTHADAQKWLPAEFKLGDTFVLPDSTTTTHATDESGTPYTVTQIDHIEIQISGTEDITTPAGDFKNCLKAVEKMTSTTTQVKNGVADASRTGTVYLTTWYAPGIGKAREIYDDGFPTTTELYAYVIAGIGNEQIRPTATIGDVMRTGQVVDTRILAIQFSEPMLLTTVNSDSVQVIDPNGQQVPITVSSSTLSNSLTVEADASYTPISGIYQIKLNDKIQDLAGNALVPLEQSLDVTIPQACCNWSGATIYLWAH